MNDASGCEHCRAAVWRSELPIYGMSDVAKLIVRRCDVCGTFWLESERWIHAVTDDDAAREVPDVVTVG